MRTTSPAFLSLVLLAACIDPKPLPGEGDDTAGADGDTVFAVNDGTIPADSLVTLEGVVVTSPINRDGDGFFVADPAGGANSGLYVWRRKGFTEIATSVIPRNELTVTGTVVEHDGWTELDVDSLDDVTVTGEADVPAPVDLGDGEGVDWEAYESVSVTLAEQTVVAVDAFNTGTLSAGIKLDDGFQYLDFDCRGSFTSITGIVFFEFGAHSLNPRADDDMVGYAPPEVAPSSIAAIQSGAMCGPVVLENVVATTPAVDDDGSSLLFVQDVGGGPGSGMGVYVKDALVPVQLGDTVTLTGDAGEFYDFTQLYVTDPDAVAITGSGDPVAESLSAAPADWEPYEGMLVTLADVGVTSDEDFGEVTTDWNISIGGVFYDHSARDGDRFATVTGVVYYSFEEWKIEPRSAADLVAP